MESEWSPNGTLNGALKGAFKGSLKGKVQRQLLLVYLLGELDAREAPYVALLIRSIQRGTEESPGAGLTAAPLEAE